MQIGAAGDDEAVDLLREEAMEGDVVELARGDTRMIVAVALRVVATG